jgi:RNA polymerase sigma factor (sigma-70 family)
LETFDQVFEQYIPMIYHNMKRLKIYKNEEEFFQIGLIALWKAYKKYDQTKGNFSSFAYSYIKGEMINALIKSKKFEDRSIHFDQSYWEHVLTTENDSIPEIVELNEAIQALPEKEKTLLIYQYYQGLSLKEIAHLEGVSLTTIKKRKKRALNLLYEFLSE